MARLNEEDVANLARQYLQPVEQLQYSAIAWSLPSWMFLMGALLVALFQKWYVVALTDRRLLLIRYKGRLKPQEITEYDLRSLPRVEFTPGSMNASLKVHDPRGNISFRFGRFLTKQNRPNALSLGTALMAAAQAGGAGGFNAAASQGNYANYGSGPGGSNPGAATSGGSYVGPSGGPAIVPPQPPNPVLPTSPSPTVPPNGAAGLKIRIGTRAIPLAQNARLTEDDLPGLLSNDPSHVVAIVEPNPANPTILGLRNVSTSPWNATLTSGERREVPAGRAIKLDRGTQLDFGFVQGVID